VRDGSAKRCPWERTYREEEHALVGFAHGCVAILEPDEAGQRAEGGVDSVRRREILLQDPTVPQHLSPELNLMRTASG
jgi:hypothetical protein